MSLHSLPPANKVWGKVIFLHLFVILFTGGAWSQGGLPGPGVGAWSWGVPGPRGVCLVRGVPGGDPPRAATAVGGTHPTRMHSC